MSIRIPWAKPHFGGREKEYLVDALDSTWISGGPYVDKFEQTLARHLGSPHGLAVSNGTTALEVALLGLGVGPGDEVIVPDFTFVAPGNMALVVGATPVFADVDASTWCLDPADVAQRITPRTKVIMAVHLYGNVCDMEALVALAGPKGIRVVEDTAEALFSRRNGRYAGTFGDAGCFSFQATKTITTGEGGLVTTPHADVDEKMRVIRDHGMRKGKRYWHDAIGHNFRLTNLQAAVGMAQYEALDAIVSARKRMYRAYVDGLAGLRGVSLQRFAPEVDPVVWAVAFEMDPAAFRFDRDGMIRALAEAGVETRPGFYPFGAMPLYGSAPLPVAERLGRNVISVPSFPGLTENEIGFVCDQLRALGR